MSKEFNKKIDEKIADLVKNVVDDNTILEIENLTNKLLNSGNPRLEAIKILQNQIGFTPKRPLFYLNDFIYDLPNHTRDIARYAGDYIDYLIKHFAHEQSVLKILALYSSLGKNLKELRKTIDYKLYQNLENYNKYIYTPAKHDFDVKDALHRFSVKEAVSIVFISLALGKQIINLSKEAKDYSQNKLHGPFS